MPLYSCRDLRLKIRTLALMIHVTINTRMGTLYPVLGVVCFVNYCR